MTDDADARPPHRRNSRVDLSDLRFNYGVAQSGLPILVFWIANNAGPTEVALVLAFVTAVAVVVRNKQSGVIRMLSILSFVIVAAAAVAGLILDNDKAFAAQNIVSDFAMAAIGLGSIAVARPIIGVISRELVPGLRPILPVTDRTFVILTVAFVVLNLFQAIVRIYMLDAMSTNTYIIVSRVFALPLNIAFFGLAWYMVSRRVGDATTPSPPLRGEAAP
jgi:intracellular septation protein A